MNARYRVVETDRRGVHRWRAEDEAAAERFAAGLRAAHPDALVRVEPVATPKERQAIKKRLSLAATRERVLREAGVA